MVEPLIVASAVIVSPLSITGAFANAAIGGEDAISSKSNLSFVVELLVKAASVVIASYFGSCGAFVVAAIGGDDAAAIHTSLLAPRTYSPVLPMPAPILLLVLALGGHAAFGGAGQRNWRRPDGRKQPVAAATARYRRQILMGPPFRTRLGRKVGND